MSSPRGRGGARAPSCAIPLAELKRARPRLIVTTTTLPRWEGDPEPRFVLDLAIALRSRFEITILAPASPGAAAEEMLEGIKVQRYRYMPHSAWEVLTAPGAIMPRIRANRLLLLLVPWLLAGQAIALARLLRNERYDALHAHWLVPQGLIYAVLARVMRCPPAVVTSHGGDVFTLNRRPMRWLKEWAMRRMAAATGVSREVVTELCALTGLEGPEVRHIPMGVDLARFRSDKAPGPRTISHHSPVRLLFVGRLAEKKGVPILLQALRQPELAGRDICLRIVGDGPLRHELEASASDLVATDRVVFVGALPHAFLRDEFGAADLFCAPFVVAEDGDRDGMPTVLLEAAAGGLPIITSDIGGSGDLIVPNESGWLLPPGSPERLAKVISEAIDAPSLAARYARSASERVAAYDWSEVAHNYAMVIDQVIEAHWSIADGPKD